MTDLFDNPPSAVTWAILYAAALAVVLLTL